MVAAKTNPPPLIGGLDPRKSKTGVCIDWFSCTLPYHAEIPKSPYFAQFDERYEDLAGMHGYNRGRRYNDGRILLFHETRHEMGRHWIFSGSTLNELSERGCVPYQLIKAYIGAGGKATRLDLAVDCWDTGLSLDKIEALIKAGEFDASSRKFSRVNGIGDTPGHTIYVGSRQSEQCARLYDKAAETGKGGDWIRLETELKGERAQFAAAMIAREGARKTSDLAVSVLRGLIDFPGYDTWNEVLNRDKFMIPKSNKQQSNTKEWLLNSVASTLGRLLAKEKNDDFWFRFIDRVKHFREEYENRLQQSDKKDDKGE